MGKKEIRWLLVWSSLLCSPFAWAASVPFDTIECGWLGQGRENQGPAAKAICNKSRDKTPAGEKKLGIEALRNDMYVAGAYHYVASLLPQGSPQQKALIEAQARYYDERDACGQDLKCILRVEKERHQQLHRQRDALEQPLPVKAIVRVSQGWTTPEGESLTQRLLEGLGLQPLPRVTLDDGRSVVWGFVPHAAILQSMVVLSPKAQVEALVTADDVYMGEGKSGNVRVYLPDGQNRDQILPIVQSWVAASAAGFNVDCRKDQAVCRPVPLKVAVEIVNLSCKAKSVRACAQRAPSTLTPGPSVALFTQ